MRNGLPGGSPLRIAARIRARDDPRTEDSTRLNISKNSAQTRAPPRLPVPEAIEPGLRALEVFTRQSPDQIRLQKRHRAQTGAEGRLCAVAVDDDGCRREERESGRAGERETNRQGYNKTR